MVSMGFSQGDSRGDSKEPVLTALHDRSEVCQYPALVAEYAQQVEAVFPNEGVGVHDHDAVFTVEEVPHGGG